MHGAGATTISNLRISKFRGGQRRTGAAIETNLEFGRLGCLLTHLWHLTVRSGDTENGVALREQNCGPIRRLAFWGLSAAFANGTRRATPEQI